MVFQVQKSLWLSHCESFVVNKGFRQGLGVTVIFYTVHNHTKTQPRVRKKRHCIYANLLRLNLGYDTTKIILSVLALKVVSEKRLEANSNFGVATFGCGNHFKRGVTDLNNGVFQLAKQQGYWPKNAESEKR